MAKAFVTGANGFIGSHLIELLLTRGNDVTGLVRSTSDVRNLMSVFSLYADRLRLVVGDIRQPESFATALQDIAFVYHLAAVLLGSSRSEFMETNVEGTRKLLEVVKGCRHTGFQRFLYVSSLAAAGPSPGDAAINESVTPMPVSWYGESKRDAEAVVNACGASGFPVTIVRPVAVYGEREQDLSRGTFPLVKSGLRPKVGFAPKHVSFVYVGDLVKGFVAAAEHQSSVRKTYFLSDPHSYRDDEIVAAVCGAMGKRFRIPVVTPHWVLFLTAVLAEWLHLFTRGRPLLTRDKVKEIRQRAWSVSAGAAQRDLGWVAEVKLDEGMRRAVRDWSQRTKALEKVDSEPVRDRAIQTFSVAIAFGIAVEGVTRIANWYVFHPWWLVFIVIVGVFGGVMGSLSLVSERWPIVAQFVAGAIVGIGAEVLNAFWLHAWEFAPVITDRLPGAWTRSILLGLPAGLMPVFVNSIIRSLYQKRLRVG